MIKCVLLLLGRKDRNLPGEKLKEKNDKMIRAEDECFSPEGDAVSGFAVIFF